MVVTLRLTTREAVLATALAIAVVAVWVVLLALALWGLVPPSRWLWLLVDGWD